KHSEFRAHAWKPETSTLQHFNTSTLQNVYERNDYGSDAYPLQRLHDAGVVRASAFQGHEMESGTAALHHHPDQLGHRFLRVRAASTRQPDRLQSVRWAILPRAT